MQQGAVRTAGAIAGTRRYVSTSPKRVESRYIAAAVEFPGRSHHVCVGFPIEHLDAPERVPRSEQNRGLSIRPAASRASS